MAITKLVSGSLGTGVGGKIGQVQSTLYTTTFSQSISATTDTNISNVNVSITPTSTSSKIFLFARLFHESNSSTFWDNGFFFRRGTTKINAAPTVSGSQRAVMTNAGMGYYAADSSSTPEFLNMFTIDSPSSTSALTYHIGINARSAGTIYVNRTVDDTTGVEMERGTSEIIAMEILS